MTLLITICARGGSKGIPGKNIRPVNGIPLIHYTIRHALEYAKKTGADVALTTDSQEIKDVAAEAGLTTGYDRPTEFATDAAGKLPVIDHVRRWEEERRGKTYDMILDLDVTSPLRTIADLDAGLQLMTERPEALNLFSVSPPAHNPYFDMVEEKEKGFFALVKKPDSAMQSRQKGPRVYDMNASFYFYRRQFFEGTHDTPLTDRSLVYVMPHMCFELDSMMEFELLDYLVSKGKLDFTFP